MVLSWKYFTPSKIALIEAESLPDVKSTFDDICGFSYISRIPGILGGHDTWQSLIVDVVEGVNKKFSGSEYFRSKSSICCGGASSYISMILVVSKLRKCVIKALSLQIICLY